MVSLRSCPEQHEVARETQWARSKLEPAACSSCVRAREQLSFQKQREGLSISRLVWFGL